jgi:hypothetical protein
MIAGDTIICTLFEGHYHFGVASLVNSLYAQGYRGGVFAGYRGELPSWTSSAKINESLPDGSKSLDIAPGLQLHLIPLSTDYHLTNYKPDFMLQLLELAQGNARTIFYFDPDIVVIAPWTFFREWVECGVALCEDVNSPLGRNHPRRIGWRTFYSQHGVKLAFRDQAYANGGFIGLTAENKQFLLLWKRLQELMSLTIGGLHRSVLNGSLFDGADERFSPFGKTDQDALNGCVEAWEGEVSFVGKEGMSLGPGQAILPHAVGHPKPWRWKPLKQALSGRPPRLVDKMYWENASGVIPAHSSFEIRRKRVALRIASVISRFYKRA